MGTVRKLLSVSTVAMAQRAFLLPFATHFRSQGWRVDGLANGIAASAECVAVFDHVYEINWSRNPLLPRNLTQAVRRVRGVVEAGRYDIVHVHTPVAAFVARFALRTMRGSGLRVIYTTHGFHFHPAGNPLKNLAFLALEKVAARWTDYLVVINRDDEIAATRHQFVPAERLQYMPGIGVDSTRLTPPGNDAQLPQLVRDELGIGQDGPIFLMIAEFNAGKRHRDAIRAFAQLNRPAYLLLAGTGPKMSAMQALVRDLGVEGRVRFLGFRKDIPSLICAAAATVLPSEREGLPRSVMESMSLEVPVIGTKIRGVRDLLADDAGILVPVGDVAALRNAMLQVIDNPERARQMGRRARQRIVENYDLRHIIQLHEDLYNRALGPQDVHTMA